MPKLFHKGGHFNQKHQWDGRSEEQRVLAIMDWVQEHNFEHRAWMTAWGQQKEPEVEGTSEDWTIYYKPAPSKDDPVFGHAQLQKSIGYTARYTRQPLAPAYGESSIVRKVTGKQLDEAYEGRDVYIVGLPELFYMHLHTRTAHELYKEWMKSEVIIGQKPPRGHHRGDWSW